MPGDIIVYDLETKETFQEVGSRDPRKLHITMLGMFSYNENKFLSFEEAELPLFWRRLEQCDLLIGFNNRGFDDVVASAYFPEVSKLNRFDILEEIYKRLGFRIKLDNLAQATLGVGKSGSGLQAIELYKNGQIDELRSYCLDDVKITKELYEYGKLHGSLKYQDLQGTKEVLVNFNPEIKQPESLNLSLF